MIDRLAVDGEAGGAVGHDALALGGPDRGTQVGFGALAEDAVRLLALRGVAGDHLRALVQEWQYHVVVDTTVVVVLVVDTAVASFLLAVGVCRPC